MTPTLELWNLVVESGYSRATEELPASWTNEVTGETILLQDKIAFWRREIPEATGNPACRNVLLAQRSLQQDTQVVGLLETWMQQPIILVGDLAGWRQGDLLDYIRQYPAGSPTTWAPPGALASWAPNAPGARPGPWRRPRPGGAPDANAGAAIEDTSAAAPLLPAPGAGTTSGDMDTVV